MNKTFFLIIGFFLCFGSGTKAQDTTLLFQYTIPLLSSNDDVEENLSTGGVYINSTDLELAYAPDDNANQSIGLHFSDIPITSAMTLLNASIQFATDEVSTGLCNLSIYGEKEVDAAPFSDENFDVTNRQKTITSSSWSPPSWTVLNASGSSQRSPNISSILNEIINQPDWESGNAINFIIEGSGSRIAHSYDGNPSLAPKLVIQASVTVNNGDLSTLYINELMAANTTFSDEYGETDDWLEIYNASDTPAFLSGLYLSDDATDLMKWQVEEPLIIDANGFYLFWLDDTPEQGANHAPFKLSSAGESVFLSQEQDGVVVILDEVTFENLSPNISYGRETDGAENWVLFGDYTPNESNDEGGLFFDATLDFSLETGHYNNSIPLTMTCSDPTAEIRYTVDGSTPTSTSTLYAQPLFLSETTVVHAAAFQPGFTAGPKRNEFYLINGNHELPVIQINIEPNYLWSDEEGFYIRGTNGAEGYCSESPVNWNQDWEYPAQIRYLETDGGEAFQVNAGMKISGGCSRNYALKGFNFFLRGDGVSDNEVEYPLFQDLDFEEYKRFKLRSSGNDYELTLVRDAAIHALLRGQVDLDLMAHEPVVVYLNGEYWGVQAIREFFGKHYIAAHHEVSDKDSLDMIKGNPSSPDSEIKEGDRVAWDELTDYVTNNSLVSNQSMSQVLDWVDINEYINYHIAQVYVVNYDWPANNNAVWRDRADGKWRWMLYDLDISSGFGQWSPSNAWYNMINHATTPNGSWWPNNEPSTRFLRKLLQNGAFRNEFTQRSCTFGQVIFAPERTEHFIDSLSQRIESEMPAMFDKFNNPSLEWANWTTSPAGGSLWTWQNNLEDYKDFFATRLSYLLGNYEGHFGYDGHYNLTINFDENTNGTVIFHQNEMKIPFGYSGEYFKNVPMQIKAIPNEGYKFIRWEETGNTNATLQYISNTNSILTPIFALETTAVIEPISRSALEVYPIPAQSELTILYGEDMKADFEIRIVNTLGQIIYMQTLQADIAEKEHLIDVQNWIKGIYFLEAIINGRSEVVKILIE